MLPRHGSLSWEMPKAGPADSDFKQCPYKRNQFFGLWRATRKILQHSPLPTLTRFPGELSSVIFLVKFIY
ncbi:hypothetical protein GQ457_13G018180 [Hibiscus cannabinus]